MKSYLDSTQDNSTKVFQFASFLNIEYHSWRVSLILKLVFFAASS
jgi:hypothetical protein